MKKFTYIISGIIFLLSISACKKNVIVETDLGIIEGNDEGSYHAFLGIPYAMPPVGDLRWRAPQPRPDFTKPYLAKWFRSGCSQFSELSDVIRQCEDCLYLNIWRPASGLSNLPVMVYIHGGAFALGASSEYQYNGSVLAAEKGVIVVSMNYRLGYLGFLSLPELSSEAGGSGNYAYLDQNLALRWVHDHIADFGGDPRKVMLFGESAGAMSTCMHLASPMSENYFQSAAVQSGFCGKSDLGPIMSQEEAEEAGEKFAEAAGCTLEDRLACLRGKTVMEINEALKNSGYENGPITASNIVPLSVVVDGKFMLQEPMDALAGGSAEGKSILIGANQNEGPLFAVFEDRIDDETAYFSLLESLFGDAAQQLAALYPYDQYDSGLSAFADITGDRLFVCPALATADAAAEGGSNVYFYHFVQDVQGLLPLITMFISGNYLDFGTFHSSDVPYVFGVPSLMGNLNGTRIITSNLMQGYWVNTAAMNTPNGAGLIEWPMYTVTEKKFLTINESPEVNSNLKQEKCACINSLKLL